MNKPLAIIGGVLVTLALLLVIVGLGRPGIMIIAFLLGFPGVLFLVVGAAVGPRRSDRSSR